ncbi:MAG: hypothetical protein VYD19_11475 [Myxococcota bacterium]|nr:hypothetical protein [Myxococcota bacterium]
MIQRSLSSHGTERPPFEQLRSVLHRYHQLSELLQRRGWEREQTALIRERDEVATALCQAFLWPALQGLSMQIRDRTLRADFVQYASLRFFRLPALVSAEHISYWHRRLRCLLQDFFRALQRQERHHPSDRIEHLDCYAQGGLWSEDIAATDPLDQLIEAERESQLLSQLETRLNALPQRQRLTILVALWPRLRSLAGEQDRRALAELGARSWSEQEQHLENPSLNLEERFENVLLRDEENRTRRTRLRSWQRLRQRAVERISLSMGAA